MTKVSNSTTDSDFLDAFYRAASRRQGAFGRRIIFWCTTRRIHTGMPPRRWIGFWGFSIVDFEVYSAEKGK